MLDAYPYPRWSGEPLVDAVLLVHGEQGVGDEILFATCYEHLLDRAAHCVLICDPRLAPLFRRSFPEADVIGYERRKDHQPAPLSRTVDWQVPAGSVPRFFRRRADDFPRRRQFLHTDPQLAQEWRNRLAALGGAMRVGISSRAGGQPAEHHRRSTNLADWQPLLAVPGVRWINLQYGDTSQECAWAKTELGITIHDWADGDPLIDLDGFAARLAALDLVISVGNATVHLAGALGVTTWAILPQTPNWRWGLQGEQSLWYASVRLVRQAAEGLWEPVFQKVAQDLQALLAGRGGPPAGAAAPTRASALAAGNPLPGVAPPPVSAEIADMQAALRQAIAHFDAGRFEQSEMLCRAVLCLAPRQIRGLHLMARLCRRNGRTQLALDMIRRALAVQQRPELRHELCLILADLGCSDAARAPFERTLRGDPGTSPAPLTSNRPVPDALPRSTEPGGAEFWIQLGFALRSADRLPEAAQAYHQAVVAGPHLAAAWNNLAAVHCELQHWSQAEVYARRALELAPNSEQALINLGEALHNRGDFAGQMAALERAVRLHPESAIGHWNLSQAMLLQADYSGGWDHYEWRERAGQVAIDAYPFPRWQGEPLDGALTARSR